MSNEEIIMEDIKAVKKEGGIEKHIQTVLLSVISVSIIGAYSVVSNINEKVIRMEEREITKKEQIDNMQISLNKMQLDMLDLKDRMKDMESDNKRKR